MPVLEATNTAPITQRRAFILTAAEDSVRNAVEISMLAP